MSSFAQSTNTAECTVAYHIDGPSRGGTPAFSVSSACGIVTYKSYQQSVEPARRGSWAAALHLVAMPFIAAVFEQRYVKGERYRHRQILNNT